MEYAEYPIAMDGIISVNKPQGRTSHDIVQEIRSIIKNQKVGHFGTLDPMATGVLLIAVGKATRLFPFFSKMEKEYQGLIRLGMSTDTYDAWGEPVHEEKNFSFPDEKMLIRIMKSFEGRVMQTAPLFSAKKHQGKPLYKFARKNQEVSIKPHQVEILYFRLTNTSPPEIGFEVLCSSGTYIRSLAHELGIKLGCGAHLSKLVRSRVANFRLQKASTLEEIRAHMKNHNIQGFLIPLESLLPHFPKIILNEAGRKRAQSGGVIQPMHVMDIQIAQNSHTERSDDSNEYVVNRLFSPDGKLIAFARMDPEKNGLHPFLVIDANNPPAAHKEAK